MPQIRLEPTSRHPVVYFMLYLLIFSSLTIALGAPPPGSVNEALPRWGVYAWAASLFFGSVSIIWGVQWQRALGRKSVDGALLEMVGMCMLSAPGILYAVAAIVAIKWAGLIPAGLVLGLAVACGYRAWDINRQIEAYLARKAQETAADGDS